MSVLSEHVEPRVLRATVAIAQSEPNLVINDVGAMSRRLERYLTRRGSLRFSRSVLEA
jgi:hypothetical protein